MVATDKVYCSVSQVAGYVESDPLGGHDPYSASRAMADILTQSWVARFPDSVRPWQHVLDCLNGYLALEATKAVEGLAWRNRLPFPSSLKWTVDWQRAVSAGASPLDMTLQLIADFIRLS